MLAKKKNVLRDERYVQVSASSTTWVIDKNAQVKQVDLMDVIGLCMQKTVHQ